MRSPLTMTRRSVRVLIVSGLSSLAILFGWAFEWLPDDRPFLVLMVYLALLAVAVGSGIVAAVASCHMAVGRAFSAGMRAGAAPGTFEPDWDQRAPRLRSVN